MPKKHFKEILIRNFSNYFLKSINAKVFLLHRVGLKDPSRLEANENLKVSPVLLEKFIVSLINEGVKFVSLDQLYFDLNNNLSLKNKVAFTFDDGYLDNFEIALPIFKKYNVPFSIFVTPAFVDGEKVIWWYLLEDLILNYTSISFNNTIIDLSSLELKNSAFIFLREYLLNNIDSNNTAEEIISRIFDCSEFDIYYYSSSFVMPWQTLRYLSNYEPLVTLGGHTFSHLPLSNLRSDLMEEEVNFGNFNLSINIDSSVKYFAYPFGSKFECGDREFSLLNNTSINMSFTTRNGSVSFLHKYCKESLPRIELTDILINSLTNK